MKAKYLLILTLLLVALFAFNPNLAAHRAALIERENSGLAAAGMDAGSPLLLASIARTVERRTGRKDYGLFSLTTVNYSDTLPPTAPADLLNRTVGIGILGKVWLWSQM